MLRDKLIPLLEQKFGASSFTKGIDPDPIASFPPAHPEVGELKIFDDGDELTVEISEITHGHFSSMDIATTQEDVEQAIAENVVAFIEDLFKDKYILWRTNRRGFGGWEHVDSISEDGRLTFAEDDAILFTWSGPLDASKKSRIP